MDRASKSIFVFGLYMIGEGLVLLVIPGVFLKLLKLPGEELFWVRVVGWALFVLGYYYVQAARHNFRDFYHWTVQIRVAQFVLFIVFVLLNFVGPIIVVLSGIEFLAGVWTFWALRVDRKNSKSYGSDERKI